MNAGKEKAPRATGLFRDGFRSSATTVVNATPVIGSDLKIPTSRLSPHGASISPEYVKSGQKACTPRYSVFSLYSDGVPVPPYIHYMYMYSADCRKGALYCFAYKNLRLRPQGATACFSKLAFRVFAGKSEFAIVGGAF
jgi:hypothetical protein